MYGLYAFYQRFVPWFVRFAQFMQTPPEKQKSEPELTQTMGKIRSDRFGIITTKVCKMMIAESVEGTN